MTKVGKEVGGRGKRRGGGGQDGGGGEEGKGAMGWGKEGRGRGGWFKASGLNQVPILTNQMKRRKRPPPGCGELVRKNPN